MATFEVNFSATAPLVGRAFVSIPDDNFNPDEIAKRIEGRNANFASKVRCSVLVPGDIIPGSIKVLSQREAELKQVSLDARSARELLKAEKDERKAQKKADEEKVEKTKQEKLSKAEKYTKAHIIGRNKK